MQYNRTRMTKIWFSPENFGKDIGKSRSDCLFQTLPMNQEKLQKIAKQGM